MHRLAYLLPLAGAVACGYPSGRVTLSVEGNGVITSNPPGYVCDGDGCLIDRDIDEPGLIEFTAVPQSVSTTFMGWLGDCNGRNTCVIDVGDQWNAFYVTAQFRDDAYRLAIEPTGRGTYQVTSSDGMLDCGTVAATSCDALYPANIDVELTATVTAPTVLVDWHDIFCRNAPSCTIKLTSTRILAPQFSIPVGLKVARAGTGSGVVTGPGIDCGSVCQNDAIYSGTSVTLHAEPDAGSRFVGWSSPCPVATSANCTFTLDLFTSLEATFDLL